MHAIVIGGSAGIGEATSISEPGLNLGSVPHWRDFRV